MRFLTRFDDCSSIKSENSEEVSECEVEVEYKERLQGLG